MDLNIGIKLSIAPFKYGAQLCKKIKNYFSRPKLVLEFGSKEIKFVSDKEELHDYFCLIIRNNTSEPLSLNLKSVKINNESYQVLIQSDLNFSRLNKTANGWTDCGNDILKTFSNNWQDICQNIFDYKFDSAVMIFPLNIINERFHAVIGYKKSSLFFFQNLKSALP